MMAKLIIWAPSREQALARARRALAEFQIEGVPSVLLFHCAVLQAPAFCARSAQDFHIHTRWIETDFAAELARLAPAARPAAQDETLLRLPVEIDGRRYQLALPARLLAALPGSGPASAGHSASAPAEPPDPNALPAPAAANLHAWKVPDGQRVQAGQLVAIMEAMKMEMQVTAHKAGVLRHLIPAGQAAALGQPLARIE